MKPSMMLGMRRKTSHPRQNFNRARDILGKVTFFMNIKWKSTIYGSTGVH